jgi:hypothetical protein
MFLSMRRNAVDAAVWGSSKRLCADDGMSGHHQLGRRDALSRRQLMSKVRGSSLSPPPYPRTTIDELQVYGVEKGIG